MIWFVIIYFCMSLTVMDIVKPQNDPDEPITLCIACFLLGGVIFILAVVCGIVKAITGKEIWK